MMEKTYGKVFKATLRAVNPVKKMVIKAECKVHKFINNQSIIILKNDGYTDAWKLFGKYADELNSGVVWADQDLKSSNHFYNPYKNKGLYGCSDALKECTAYYAASLTHYDKKDIRKAMFYLGASCHLIQDVTVPQHASVKLMKHHRTYEKWVIRTYNSHDSFKCINKGVYLDKIKDFIEQNALVAIDAYNKHTGVKDREERFFNITDIILCQAQRSTAGFLNMFYKDVCSIDDREYLIKRN